jgi:predicted metal-binding protein
VFGLGWSRYQPQKEKGVMFMSKGTFISKSVRQAKMAAYKKCAFCGSSKDLEIAHFNPRLEATFENLIVCCSQCHMKYMHDEEVVHRHADMVRESIREAKARGVHFGKKPADYEKVMRLIAENSTQFNPNSLTTEHEIMEMAGVKEVCYAKCKRMLIAAIQDDVWKYDFSKPKQIRNHPMYEHHIKRIRGSDT